MGRPFVVQMEPDRQMCVLQQRSLMWQRSKRYGSECVCSGAARVLQHGRTRPSEHLTGKCISDGRSAVRRCLGIRRRVVRRPEGGRRRGIPPWRQPTGLQKQLCPARWRRPRRRRQQSRAAGCFAMLPSRFPLASTTDSALLIFRFKCCCLGCDPRRAGDVALLSFTSTLRHMSSGIQQPCCRSPACGSR